MTVADLWKTCRMDLIWTVNGAFYSEPPEYILNEAVEWWRIEVGYIYVKLY